MSVLTDTALIEQLAGRLDISRAEAARLLESTVGVLKDNLLEGHELALRGFLSLHVVEEAARLVQLPGSAARLIEAPRRALVTEPQAPFERAMAEARLTPILLLVSPGDVFGQVLDYHFAEAGWRVELAHQPAAALDELRDGGSPLVIVEGALPGAEALLEQLKLARATSATPVIAFFPRGARSDRPDRLRVQADCELVEPFELGELLAVAERALARSAEERLLFDHQARLVLPCTHAALDRATELTRRLLAASGLDEAARTAFHAAVREAIGNAVQHGGRFDPAKAVHIEYLVDARRVTVIVRDEGTGFDHRRFLARAAHRDPAEAARQRQAEGGRGGLGILMMTRAADRIEYNEAGTVVTLTRLLQPRAPAAARDPSVEPALHDTQAYLDALLDCLP